MPRKRPAKETNDKASMPVVIPQPIPRIVSRSPAFASLYANDVQMHTSAWDVRLILGELGDPTEGPVPSVHVNQVGELRMSPQMAKKLVQVMIGQLQAYERLFGHIPEIPDGPSNP